MEGFARCRFSFVIFLLALYSQNLLAARYSSHQVIVKLKGETTTKTDDLSKIVARWEAIVPSLGIYVADTKNLYSIEQTMSELSKVPGVEYAVPDYEVTLRDMPNDPDFKLQWSLNPSQSANIGAASAWNITKGGKDAAGNDIVVAIVDGGVDVMHEDLKGNIWVNQGEIPGNGKDDDGNGYIDDINGWNAFDNSGKLPRDSHATHVAGIVGASGNNSLQVTGVNQQIKIMTVNGVSSQTSIVLKAYNYVLTQKKIWLESKGSRGANVVATNSSFGVDYADCNADTYKPWNEIYALMGSYGILSAAATANLDIDVDTKGDVPTGCNTEALITVTNTNQTDQKEKQAGYGKTTIDLGAPGTEILSTVPGQSVLEMTGTSMATPHVAGAIGLLHSAANKTFNDFYLSSPKDASLVLKKILLENTESNESLKNKTVSGGRLNLYKATQAISNFQK